MSSITGVVPKEECTETFLTYIHSPLTGIYNEVLILLFILFLIPARYLRNWVLYIASWAIPLAVWFVATTEDAPGTITWVNSPASAALLAINSLIVLTVGYIVVRFSWTYWRTRTNR